MIHFEKPPAIGTTVSLDGQVYEYRGTIPHTKLDGSGTILLAWETLCPSCGRAVVIRSTLKSHGFTRRCSDCAKAGKPVKGKRGRKIVVVIHHA